MSSIPEILLVPVDGSKGANAAAAYAAALAARLSIPVRLLFAFPETPMQMFGVPGEVPNRDDLRYFSPEAFDKLRADSARVAFEAARKAMGDAVAPEEVILSGEAERAILDHAEGVDGAAIVMGRRGLSHFREILVGSVTQRVLHHAKCPVFVIR
ncbi:MAG: universal stress protein [Ectothiorhodospiraceae bacterium]|nr:universal stress protein [Ectothiorhodospiraceae bacterium]MCH8505927.1 universal stress protein [Ectothiorhodospiraceae bacterium]